MPRSHAPATSGLNLRLADGTPAEAFGRLAAALDSGRVTPGQARDLAALLRMRLVVVEAEEFSRRLQAAEEKVLADAKARQLPVAAGEFTVVYDREQVTPKSPEAMEAAPSAASVALDSMQEPAK